MQLIILFIAVSTVAGSISIDRTSSQREVIHEMFALAYTHKVEQLANLEDVVSRRGHLLRNAYILALYIANPSKFAERFATEFPTDTSGIMGDYSHTLAEHYMLGQLPFGAIDNLALAGNKTAISRVVNGWQHSDGYVAELFGDTTADLTNAQPEAMLQFLESRSSTYRRNFACAPQIRNTLRRSNLIQLRVNGSGKNALLDLRFALAHICS